MGRCLELNTSAVYEQKLARDKNKRKQIRKLVKHAGGNLTLLEDHHSSPYKRTIKELNLVVGINATDYTYGSKGLRNAIQIYYMHPGNFLYFSIFSPNNSWFR